MGAMAYFVAGEPEMYRFAACAYHIANRPHEMRGAVLFERRVTLKHHRLAAYVRLSLDIDMRHS